MTNRIAAGLLLLIAFAGCSKDKVFEEPYGQGREPLAITLENTQVPQPASGLAGTEVTIQAKGLLEYKDQLIFRFNGEQARITEVNGDGLKVIVPDNASTGVTSLSVGDVVFFGPQFTVEGKINFDPTFTANRGTDGQVIRVLDLSDGKKMLVGDFTNYDNRATVKPISRIVRTFSNGTYDASFSSGRGANGVLTSIVNIGNKLFIAGGFSGYDQRTENISNITRISLSGKIDTMGIHTFRRPKQTDTIKYFPTFNGGFNSNVGALYEQNGKLIAVGSFRYYISRRYDRPNKLETRDTVILDSTEIHQIARLNTDGTLDKTYRFDGAGKTLSGGNGNVGSVYHTEGALKDRMLIFGDFTTFDGQSKGRIARLMPDGTLDASFNTGGTGTETGILSATYNATTRKYFIVGNFRTYNGASCPRMALLNEDGSRDPSFVPREVTGGNIYFSKQLSDGHIAVSGSFITYGGVTRNGLMVLNPDGTLAAGYNATGPFNGVLSDIVETKSEEGKRALLLIGVFDRFDNTEKHNITRVVIE